MEYTLLFMKPKVARLLENLTKPFYRSEEKLANLKLKRLKKREINELNELHLKTE